MIGSFIQSYKRVMWRRSFQTSTTAGVFVYKVGDKVYDYG
jgi:hypothetical protein